jgi:hypothetical protein
MSAEAMTPFWIFGQQVPVLPQYADLYQAAMHEPCSGPNQDASTEYKRLSYPAPLKIAQLIEQLSQASAVAQYWQEQATGVVRRL